MNNSFAYTTEEVVSNFEALLEQMDFHVELAMLGVGRVRFKLRRNLLEQWEALVIGLWYLALERSFPKDAQTIFDLLMEKKVKAIRDERKSSAFTTRVYEYIVRLKQSGHGDFTEIASYLLGLYTLSDSDTRSLRLRVALHIRRLYTLIFDRLI